MLKLLVKFQNRERGATAVEYGIMVALIAAVIIITVGLIGDELVEVFEEVQTGLENRGGGGGGGGGG